MIASHERGAALGGRWSVFMAALLWGTSATLARFVFRDRQVPALAVVELRLLISVLLLGPWLAWRRPRALIVRRADWGYFMILGLFGVAAVQGSYYYAISVLGVGPAILIQYMAPSLIVVYEALRGTRVRALTAAAVVAALLGTALLVGGVNQVALHAGPAQWAVGFAAAISFAFYVVFSKRGLDRYAPETVLFYTFLIAATFWAFIHPPWAIIASGYGTDLWLMFLALGLFSTLVPFSFFYAGLRRLPSSETGVVATLEPVVAVVSAAMFLGEGLSVMQWLGAVLVLGASVLPSLQRPGMLRAQPERG